MRMARDLSDRVVFLHQGLVEETGPPDQLFANPKSDRLRQFLSHGQAA
jgi:polar amino acid transport system ATP-binding protein